MREVGAVEAEEHILLQRHEAQAALLDLVIEPDLGIDPQTAARQDHVLGDMQRIREAVGGERRRNAGKRLIDDRVAPARIHRAHQFQSVEVCDRQA